MSHENPEDVLEKQQRRNFIMSGVHSSIETVFYRRPDEVTTGRFLIAYGTFLVLAVIPVAILAGIAAHLYSPGEVATALAQPPELTWKQFLRAFLDWWFYGMITCVSVSIMKLVKGGFEL